MTSEGERSHEIARCLRKS